MPNNRISRAEILAAALMNPDFARRWRNKPSSQAAEIVLHIREETGWTQAELAQKAGVGRSFISMVESVIISQRSSG